MNDYDRTLAANRFGTPTEVDTTGQNLTLAKDRGAEQIVDFGNLSDTNNAAKAGKHLQRVIDEVIVPEIDTYRLTVLATVAAANSGTVGTAAASTKSDAYDTFLAAQAKLSDALVPEAGRVAFMTTSYFNLLKSGNFTLASDAGQAIHSKGVIATVDGVQIVVVPQSWMPTNVDLIVVAKDCAVGPIKLKNYRVLDGQQGYDGNVLQWRYYYDAFVLNAKKAGVAIHKTA